MEPPDRFAAFLDAELSALRDRVVAEQSRLLSEEKQCGRGSGGRGAGSINVLSVAAASNPRSALHPDDRPNTAAGSPASMPQSSSLAWVDLDEHQATSLSEEESPPPTAVAVSQRPNKKARELSFGSLDGEDEEELNTIMSSIPNEGSEPMEVCHSSSSTGTGVERSPSKSQSRVQAGIAAAKRAQMASPDPDIDHEAGVYASEEVCPGSDGRGQASGRGSASSIQMVPPQPTPQINIIRASKTIQFGCVEEADKPSFRASTSTNRLPLGQIKEPDVRTSRQFRHSKSQHDLSRIGEPSSEVYEVLEQWSLGGPIVPWGRKSMARQSLFFDRAAMAELEELEDNDDKSRTCSMQRFMMHPSSLCRLSWDMLGLIWIAYDCLMVPLQVFDPEESTFTTFIVWCIRLFWTFNIALSFLVGYMRNDGMVEMKFSSVAKKYAMTWLPLDLLVVCFDWAELFMGQDTSGLNRVGGSLRAVRMVRTVRLFRMLKAPEIADKITEYIPMSEQLGLLATIGKIMLVFLWIAHVVACTWYGLSRLVKSGCETCATWTEVEETDEMNVADKYCLSFHWSLSALSGDTQLVLPANIFERIYATCALFLAFVVSASYVGSITTSMTRLQIIASEQSSKLAVLRRFLLDHSISRPLAVRVQRNAQHAMTEEKAKAPESSVELLKIISQPVLVEVHFEIHSRNLFNHPFMLAYNEVNPAGIRRVCHSAISMLSVHGKDILFSDLEVPDNPKMYFVVNGKLTYSQNGKEPLTFDKGSWMVEAVLWTKWTHRGTLRASTESRFLLLDAAKFQEIVSTFPSDHAALYAEEYVMWLNHQDDNPSDAGPSLTEACTMIDHAFDDCSSEESHSDGFWEEDEDEDAQGEDEAHRVTTRSQSSKRGSRHRSTTSVVQRARSWVLGSSAARRSTLSDRQGSFTGEPQWQSASQNGSVLSGSSNEDVGEGTQEENARATTASVASRRRSLNGERQRSFNGEGGRPRSHKGTGPKKSSSTSRFTHLLPSPSLPRSGGIFGSAFRFQEKSRAKSSKERASESRDDQVLPMSS